MVTNLDQSIAELKDRLANISEPFKGEKKRMKGEIKTLKHAKKAKDFCRFCGSGTNSKGVEVCPHCTRRIVLASESGLTARQIACGNEQAQQLSEFVLEFTARGLKNCGFDWNSPDWLRKYEGIFS